METAINKKKIKITREEMKPVIKALQWGRRQELAEYLGISRGSVSYILRPRDIYSVKEKKFKTYYLMTEEVYNKVLSFVNTLD